MRHLLTILAALFLSAPLHAQTIKSLGYNTTNGNIVAATNVVWTNSFSFSTNTVSAQVRTNLNLGWSALTNSNSATSLLGFTTNGQVVANVGANVLTFTNTINVSSGQILSPMGTTNFVGVGVGSTNSGLASDGFIQGNIGIVDDGNLIALFGSLAGVYVYRPITFASGVEQTRTNLGLGATWLTNTNVTNFRTAVGLGATDSATFQAVTTEVMAVGAGASAYFTADVNMVETALPIEFANNSAAGTRTNLGLPLASLTNTSNVTAMRALGGSTNTNEPFSGTVSLTNTNTLTFSNGVLLKIQ